MPISERQKGIILVVLLALFAAVAFSRFVRPEAPAPATPAAAPRAAGRVAGPEVPLVRLSALKAPFPEARPDARNPFRFEVRTEPPAGGIGPAGGRRGPEGERPVPVVPDTPPPPPPPPPIPLKFIGLLGTQPARSSTPANRSKIAILSDGRNVYYGREGDIVDGRYRIVRIGLESVEMAYVDQKATQTIPMTGSGSRP